MKDAKSLVLHFKGIPHNQKLNAQNQFERIKKLLPPRLQKAILFMYIKNRTLFFALNHPGLQMEFNYNLDSIKSVLRDFGKLDSSFPEIIDARCFVSNKIQKEEPAPSPTEPHYLEHADGRFENQAADSDIHAGFEAIRQIICSHRN